MGGRALLPGTNWRPADIFIPRWAGGRDAALDVMVTHPLKEGTRARAATEPGYALTLAYNNKMRDAANQCDQQGIAFIPVVAESLGGWHKVGPEHRFCCRRASPPSCSTGFQAFPHQQSVEPNSL